MTTLKHLSAVIVKWTNSGLLRAQRCSGFLPHCFPCSSRLHLLSVSGLCSSAGNCKQRWGHSLGTILPPAMGPCFNARGILSSQTYLQQLICITMVRRKIHFLALIILSTDLKYCLKMVVLTLAQGVCSHSAPFGVNGVFGFISSH